MNPILEVVKPILWRRLDLPGHDAASLRAIDDGTELRGMAVFQENGNPSASILRAERHRVADYRSHRDGWCGDRAIELPDATRSRR